MAKKKQHWKIGDVFLIPLPDNTYCVGQIVAREPQALNSVSIAVFDERTDGRASEHSFALKPGSIFSVLLATRDLLDLGVWKVVGNRDVTLSQEALPHESTRSSGFVGAVITGSGIINEFVSAYYGLTSWNDFHDPNYLDELLVSPDKKPSKLLFK